MTISVKAVEAEYPVVLAALNSISESDYQLALAEILGEDRRKRSHRLRHIIGVALKREYSQIVLERSGEVPHKWKIDASALRSKSDSCWEFVALSHSPERLTGETGKDLALRLHRETLLAKAFLGAIHSYVCKNGKTRKKVKSIIADIGLKEFSDLANPEGIIKIGGGALYGYLCTIMTGFPAAGIAIATIVLLVIGLESVCAASK